MKNDSSFNPFFLVGASRSGTTLLSRMLDAHPEICVSPETHFGGQCWFRVQFTRTQERRLKLIDMYMKTDHFKSLCFTEVEESFLRSLGYQTNRRFPEIFFKQLLQVYRKKMGGKFIGEKTPHHMAFVPLLAWIFPRAKFLNITRDVRAVCVSNRNAFGEEAFWNSAVRWQWYVDLSSKYKRLYPNRYLSIHYESLVSNPKKTLECISLFLGITFRNSMLKYYTRSPTFFDINREPWKINALRPLDLSRIDGWRDQMSKYELIGVEGLAGLKQIKMEGYEPQTNGEWRIAVKELGKEETIKRIKRRIFLNRMRYFAMFSLTRFPLNRIGNMLFR